MNFTDNLRTELEEGAEDIVPEAPATAGTDTPGETPEATPGAVPSASDPFGLKLDGDKVPEKFRGKSVSDVIASYTELEKKLGQRTFNKEERTALAEAGIDPKSLTADELEELVKSQDFTNMRIEDFVKWIIGTVDQRGQARVHEAVQSSQQILQRVKSEAEEAREKYPLLKTTKEFRDLVLNIVEIGQTRGEEIGLLDACEKAQNTLKALGAQTAPPAQSTPKNFADIEKAKKHATVELGAGAPGQGGEEDESSTIAKGMIAAGAGSIFK